MPKTKEQIEIEKYLDKIDLERMEIARLTDDIFTGTPQEVSLKKPITSSDKSSKWLSENRER